MRAPPETIANARRLRRALSPPEAKLWSRLRARAPGMPAFRRQHPIGAYVLDFYCAKARLAVEIDGARHDVGDRPERDMRRDAWLEAQGVTVMRIAASDVMRKADEAADGVVRMAAAMIEAEAPSAPAKSPSTASQGRVAKVDSHGPQEQAGPRPTRIFGGAGLDHALHGRDSLAALRKARHREPEHRKPF